MKTRKPYKSKYRKIYNKISRMQVNDKLFVEFQYVGSSNRFQEALHCWLKRKHPERKYRTYRLELDNPLILQVWRVE
jgi:hypothetical protein